MKKTDITRSTALPAFQPSGENGVSPRFHAGMDRQVKRFAPRDWLSGAFASLRGPKRKRFGYGARSARFFSFLLSGFQLGTKSIGETITEEPGTKNQERGTGEPGTRKDEQHARRLKASMRRL